MVWTTFDLEWKLMSVFACVIFEGGVQEWGYWGKQRPPVLLGGNQPKANLITLILSSLLSSTSLLQFWASVFVLGSANVMDSLNLFPFSVSKNQFAVFCPSVIQNWSNIFLIEHHRRAGRCSGHHYGVLCGVKHSIGRQKPISPPLKVPVMEVKWPVCSCLEN